MNVQLYWKTVTQPRTELDDDSADPTRQIHHLQAVYTQCIWEQGW